MNFETLEQRTLFAGANDVVDMTDIADVQLDVFGAEETPVSELNIAAGTIASAIENFVNDSVISPAVSASNSAFEASEYYYENPGEMLHVVGKGIEEVGHGVHSVGETLSEYAGPVIRYGGHAAVVGSTVFALMSDPTIASDAFSGHIHAVVCGAKLGAASWLASEMVPRMGGTIATMGSGLEALGGSLSSCGSELTV